ncbi:Protein indeterminate-domain 2 [Ananas comosus]|uniref:Protein EARLY HEADING DATE 2 n=1 Tax=Ananas comosus TaxID=4615 RepID=A0A199VQ45_ANACO|nr:Protein indeterminate-domain 2 [Ananas comosus]
MKELEIQHQQAVDESMSNLSTSASAASPLSSNHQSSLASPNPNPNPNPAKKKRSLPGNPDPDAEVIALSPKTLMATNRFVCEICSKGFQRDQNLQLHRRGHNLPWRLKQKASNKEVRKKVYICPEVSCVHHDPSRALGDLTGIKKHFFRKHGEKKWKCDKCSKKYAVQSDWKAHSKICGTREYKCDCGTLFSRRDSFITHRAFCDALAEETAKSITANTVTDHHPLPPPPPPLLFSHQPTLSHDFSTLQDHTTNSNHGDLDLHHQDQLSNIEEKHHDQQQQQQQYLTMAKAHYKEIIPSWASLNHSEKPFSLYPNENQHQQSLSTAASPHLSATALLQKAAQMGVTMSRAPQNGHTSTTHYTSSTSTSANYGGFGLGLSSSHEVGGSGPVFHDMMVSSLSSGSCLDGSLPQGAINGVGSLRSSHGSRNEEGGGVGGGGGGGVGDGLTRDFLGLRAFSPREIFNMAGFDPCMNPSSYHQP